MSGRLIFQQNVATGCQHLGWQRPSQGEGATHTLRLFSLAWLEMTSKGSGCLRVLSTQPHLKTGFLETAAFEAPTLLKGLLAKINTEYM